ncbi:hypothetical protein B7P33_01820 [Sediminicola luteus]|uniref:Uncharacterized protein n=2 Tax=Sediminicola luteus TaxID=319238 RepID=A0A2A4GDK4_9FLAO|nr:hypothetical protein B7P33_01820 [Sediminicola luteus]
MGIAYMRVVLGPNDVAAEGLGYLWHMFYQMGLIGVGLRVGAIVALLFITVDVLYLRKRLAQGLKSSLIRLGAIVLITLFVGCLHYILEKVIDII